MMRKSVRTVRSVSVSVFKTQPINRLRMKDPLWRLKIEKCVSFGNRRPLTPIG